MELEDTCIYNHVKQYLDEIDIIKYKKGQYITRSNQNFEEMFFILEGKISVEYTTQSGKSFLVDELLGNEFVGNISYMYDQSLYCDIIAMADSSLVRIKKNTFKKLQTNSGFLTIFLFKNSKRIYSIYKKLMMKDLFSSEELLAYYMLKEGEDNIFKFKSMYSLCKNLLISRKNLYNIINKFMEKNYIRKDKKSLIILDEKNLYEIARYVREFNETNVSDFKFIT